MLPESETAIQEQDAVTTCEIGSSESEYVAHSSPLSELMITFPVIGVAATYGAGSTVIVNRTESPRLGLASETVAVVVVEEAAFAAGSSKTVSKVQSRDRTTTQLLIRRSFDLVGSEHIVGPFGDIRGYGEYKNTFLL